MEKHGFDVKAIHCTENGLKIVEDEVLNGSILVTTWRDVPDLYENWGNNNRDLDAGKYFEGWYRLEQYCPVTVSIDNNREARLNLLGQVLGVQLNTDWEPVNHTERMTVEGIYDSSGKLAKFYPVNHTERVYNIHTDEFTPKDAA